MAALACWPPPPRLRAAATRRWWRGSQGAEVSRRPARAWWTSIEANGHWDAPELRALVARCYTRTTAWAQVDTVLLAARNYPFIGRCGVEAPEIQLLRIERPPWRGVRQAGGGTRPRTTPHTLPQAPLLDRDQRNAEALDQWMARVLGWGQVECATGRLTLGKKPAGGAAG